MQNHQHCCRIRFMANHNKNVEWTNHEIDGLERRVEPLPTPPFLPFEVQQPTMRRTNGFAVLLACKLLAEIYLKCTLQVGECAQEFWESTVQLVSKILLLCMGTRGVTQTTCRSSFGNVLTAVIYCSWSNVIYHAAFPVIIRWKYPFKSRQGPTQLINENPSTKTE